MNCYIRVAMVNNNNSKLSNECILNNIMNAVYCLQVLNLTVILLIAIDIMGCDHNNRTLKAIKYIYRAFLLFSENMAFIFNDDSF